MEIKQISVECKLSRNYNTFTVGYVLELNPGEGKDSFLIEHKTKELQAKARKLVQEQINLKS
jgi:hypothetical protein